MSRQRAQKQVKREARRESRRKTDLRLVEGLQEQGEFTAPSIKANKSPIQARNPNQQQYLTAMQTKFITLGVGSAGSGKTYLSTAHAAKLLLDKDIERIVITRPVLQADEDLGFLPGDISEKFAPYFRPVYDVLLERLGGSFLEYCLRPKIEKVQIAPFAYLRGCTFKDAVVILDEAQNTTVNQMKLFLTRLGENTTVIINGDVTQCDLPKGTKSGLQDLLERIEEGELASVTHFTDEDCVRSEICAYALKIYG